MQPPGTLETDRLTLRRWHPEHARGLKAALDLSVEHLRPWIPWAVAEPAPIPALETRLADYALRFDVGREWLYGIFLRDGTDVLGGVGLYPRAAEGRVAIALADHVEIGYWLRSDVTRRGYVTEAVRAILGVATALPRMTHVEIRCDPRNTPSVAVPQRLGFHHARTLVQEPVPPKEEPDALMVWELPLASSLPGASHG
jgi:RimJ/RimL family protein N-acetyltransferase